MTTQITESKIPGERLATQFTRDQQGWLVVALVAFLGVVLIGPAYAAAADSTRDATRRAHKKIRRLGGGAVDRVSAGVARLRR